MPRLVALAVLGLLATSSCGGGSGTETHVLGRTFERPTVSGVVHRAGVVVQGAQVSLGDGGRSTVTDTSGSYRFEGVEPGSYRLVVLDGGDNSPVCTADGACVTARSARHAAVDVVVDDKPVVVDVDL